MSFAMLVLLVVGAFGIFGAKGVKAMFMNVLTILGSMAGGLVLGVVIEAIGDWDGASSRLPPLMGILGAIGCININRTRRANAAASAKPNPVIPDGPVS